MRSVHLGVVVLALAIASVAMPWPDGRGAALSGSVALATGETCSPARPHASGTSTETVMTPNGMRSYRLHVPSSYTGSTPVPLVLNIHGLGSNASDQEAYSGFSGQSEQSGFVVAYPQGITTPFSGSTHFNAWQIGSPEPDDVAFMSALMDAVEAATNRSAELGKS